ncbi:MAG: hypothetical protein DWQ05_15860 [Calditrichaeota bacterium]|nr:MAG: hypothetical protein DWQ05_15860 [Calditrichota bacterium]
MKLRNALFLIIIVLLSATQVFAQGRSSQWEIFGGAAFPLSPDSFKDFYKVGGSFHGQYVMFPSPTVGISFGFAFEGFTVDEDAFYEESGLTPDDVTIESEATIVEYGIGIRPYLTSAESNTQLFLFGMGTYNVINEKTKFEDFFSTSEFEFEDKKWGLAAGAGLEFPAGDRLNIILQGLVRFIFTEEENTSFVGVTGGLAF